MQTLLLNTEAQRQRAVAWAVALTTTTPLEPQGYERQLLGLYQAGVLTLEEVQELLALSVYQVLYHSRATQAPTEADLQHLLTQARHYNGQHQITGLLLYGDGRYVQVLEGYEADVCTLYARIQRDPRHAQVVTVSQGPQPQRRFADWQMAFGLVTSPALEHLLAGIQLPGPEQGLADPQVGALLQAWQLMPITAVERAMPA
jgi:hypothetical protein